MKIVTFGFGNLSLLFHFIIICSLLVSPIKTYADWQQPVFDQTYRNDAKESKSIFLAPLGSFILPGLDQFLEEQFRAGALYGGMGLVGLGLQLSSFEVNEEGVAEGPKIKTFEDMPEWNDRIRRFFIGSSIYQVAGSLSMYHSFRSAAKTHGDRFSFLAANKDTSADVLKAPFEFEFLKRKTTWIPLSVLSALTFAFSRQENVSSDIRGKDFGFYSTISYGAGTGEEAMFRGWMMPYLHSYMKDEFWSNTTSALLFGATHLSTVDRPIAQTLLGWYFGWLTQRNDWSIREAVFLHTWWDVIAFTALFLDKDENTNGYINFPTITF